MVDSGVYGDVVMVVVVMVMVLVVVVMVMVVVVVLVVLLIIAIKTFRQTRRAFVVSVLRIPAMVCGDVM